MSENVLSYRAAMSVALGLLQNGIITEGEYYQIDRVFREKYGDIFGTLFLENPLLFTENRANIAQTKALGGAINVAKD